MRILQVVQPFDREVVAASVSIYNSILVFGCLNFIACSNLYIVVKVSCFNRGTKDKNILEQPNTKTLYMFMS